MEEEPAPADRGLAVLDTLNGFSRAGLVYAATAAALQSDFAPSSWGTISVCVWMVYALSRGWSRLGAWDQKHIAWGIASVAVFQYFLHIDKEFQGWGDIYYFCGWDLQYCTCDFHWNTAGWGKAFVMWNFVLSSALGLQKLAIQIGLDGLLPGEEVVTKESFISICWRLIPYWLNKWEQEWGAECSSMMFELPHFAVELLVVLPCVQIICARLKILAMPPGRGLHAPFNQIAEGDEEQVADLAPCILKGTWQPGPQQHKFMNRLRANLRVLIVVVGIAALAAFNSLCVPLCLEYQIITHPRTPIMLKAASSNWGREGDDFALKPAYNISNLFPSYPSTDCPAKGAERKLREKLDQHLKEITKMRDAEHMELIPLVEVALAIMRLSCEKFFVLISVLAAYLLFRDDVPWTARMLIRLNHRISMLFQKVILYSFPGVCWVYGAGYIFSMFVSIVFWGPPLQQMYESLRKHSTIVRPMGLEDATEEQIERMNNNCAVCWSEMGPPLPRAPMRLLGAGGAGLGSNRLAPGKSLPCGHAFHEACIKKWLAQCHGQGRRPTCPMCNSVIELEVKYRLPLPWQRLQGVPEMQQLPPPAVRPMLAAPQQEPLPAPAAPMLERAARAPPAQPRPRLRPPAATRPQGQIGLNRQQEAQQNRCNNLLPANFAKGSEVFFERFPDPEPEAGALGVPDAGNAPAYVPDNNFREGLDAVLDSYGITAEERAQIARISTTPPSQATLERHSACMKHFFTLCEERLKRWNAALDSAERQLLNATRTGEPPTVVDRLQKAKARVAEDKARARQDAECARLQRELAVQRLYTFQRVEAERKATRQQEARQRQAVADTQLSAKAADPRVLLPIGLNANRVREPSGRAGPSDFRPALDAAGPAPAPALAPSTAQVTVTPEEARRLTAEAAERRRNMTRASEAGPSRRSLAAAADPYACVVAKRTTAESSADGWHEKERTWALPTPRGQQPADAAREQPGVGNDCGVDGRNEQRVLRPRRLLARLERIDA